MSLKPHLAVLPYVVLLLRSKNPRRFLIGSLIATAVLLLPFLGIVRPPSDLRECLKAVQGYGTHVFYREEQSLGAWIYNISKKRLNSYPGTLEPGVPVNPETLKPYNRWKVIIGGIVIVVSFVGIYFSMATLPIQMVWALACGVLSSPYSHYPDAVMVMPLFLYAAVRLSRHVKLMYLVAILVGFNFSTTILLELSLVGQHVNWIGYAALSFIYFVAALVMLAIAWGLVVKRSSK